ncbi:MAG: Ribonuclease R [Candidatus Celerinatantimonas neptuna]|nr:MAG: Ribonuclease R [Candidatus Celerinatantimonas neptuna]
MPTDDISVDFPSIIFDYVSKQTAPVTIEQLLSTISVSTQEIQPYLDELLEQGQIILTRRQAYTLPKRLGLVVGELIGHRDGYGFIRTMDKSDDLFIPERKLNGAFHGDRVLVAPGSIDKRGRQEARVMKILRASQEEVVGRFFREGQIAFVVPDDNRLTCHISIDEQLTHGARQGQVVVVKRVGRKRDSGQIKGQILEVLGETMDPGMEVAMALRGHDLPHQWSTSIKKAVAKLPETMAEEDYSGRVDIRELPLVTIDGEDARDFDDAVYCETKKSGGWRLWVAIADVSYYVRPDSALDREALNRGTSVYFPDQVIPMLPEKLSNGLCSLNPSVDRACLVCEMTVSKAGRLSGYKFYPAVMHSHARLTYNKVAAILDGDELLREHYREQVPHLEELHCLYQSLKDARAVRGGIELETQEARFIFNAQRKIEQIVPLVRNDAHKIIEECMIQANVAAARFVQQHKAPILFRVHDRPSQERLTTFRSFLSELGLSLDGGDEAEPKDYFTLVEKIQQREDKELIQTMLLRSMMQAVYQPDNIGHFGLALTSYAHFTSPIRRYPDLLLHRVIKYLLVKEQGEQSQRWTTNGGYHYLFDEMEQLGEHCSMTERRADDATREVADKLKCEFMLDHVGETCDGTIAAVTGFGLFVRLDELHIDGLVHISNLGRDYFEYDAPRQMLIGRASGQRYRIGESLQVKVASVSIDERKIDLVLASTPVKRRIKRKPTKLKSELSPVKSDSKKEETDKKKKVSAPRKSPKKKRKSRPGKKERAKLKKGSKA